MEELINFIIAIGHFFRYGGATNHNRSFKKELSTAVRINDDRLTVLHEIVNEQLSALMVKGNGVPTYAYFCHQKGDWYKVFIINREEKFYCRLETIEINEVSLPENSFIFLR